MSNWIEVPQGVSDGWSKRAEERFEQRSISGGKSFIDEVAYISKLPLRHMSHEGVHSSEELILIRNLCSTWFIDLTVGEITSHRKFIGPVVVKAKKLFFPVIRFFLKDLIRQQREFNAAVVAAFIERKQ